MRELRREAHVFYAHAEVLVENLREAVAGWWAGRAYRRRFAELRYEGYPGEEDWETLEEGLPDAAPTLRDLEHDGGLNG